MRSYVKESLEKGHIRPSSSPLGAGFFFVAKKDGSLRPCIDYRLLNKITVKFQYPLPLLSDLFARIKGASWFTKIDLRGAYNLVRIRQGDEWKTAFNTPEGHFEYLVMPFGLANAPSVFQSFMHDIFREYLDKFLIVYLDDILIFSDDWESHVKQVRMVFQVLRANSLFVKGSKCLFGVQKVSFLGFIFTPSTIEMDPVKVQAIQDWIQPTSLKSLQKFLGFANFYRRFICNFSSIAKPLTDLTKKGADLVNWFSAAVEAFQELKRRFCSAPVLCQPDVSLPFQVEVDASEIGAGAVLSQRGSDCSVMKPCAFFSRKFSPAERNYDVGNRELLAMKWAFEEWRHWLEGAKHRVVVLTDHKNLTYLESAKRLNPRQARWSLFFARFDFVISYLPGSKNVKADALSRSFVPDSPGLSEPAGILKEGVIVSAISPDLRRVLQKFQANKPDRCPAEKLFVPDRWTNKLISELHCSVLAGHPGIFVYMSIDTFAYDLATTTNILSQVTGSNEFLRTPPQELRTRDYEKERRKLISYDLQCTTLAEYHRHSKIPRGLRSNLRPTLFSDNPEYCEKYKRILNKCSLDIILLTIEYLQKTIVETKHSIQAIEAQLSTALSSTEWTSLKTKTEKSLTEHQKSLQERKRQKFQRDTEDYSMNKVYKWNDTSANTGSWHRPRNQRRYGSFSSGTDASTASGRQPFLAKGRRGGQPTADPPGEQGERMATRSQYHATETFISLVDREVKQFSHQQQLGLYPVHSNLSLVEKQALKSLQNNKTIIIKPADKGGAIVVMNYTDYTKEVIRQLSDPNTYGVIQRDPVTNITTKIRSLHNNYLDRHIIDQKTASFLINPHPITPVFYILPKVHKSLQNPPGRPIVASTDSVLSPLSVFLEKMLTPLVKKTKSYLLDTGHFLEIIHRQGTVPAESILVTLDVNSLYTSITHDKGIEATRYLLESSDMSIDSIQFCLDLLDIVLCENYFLYEDTFYVQKCGTAMGANVAPAYANAYVNLFEIKHVFPNDLFSRFALGYHRYIDDIFFIWTGTSNSMFDFVSQLNSIYPELQFTLHHSTESVPFLDTLVIKDTKGDLSTDLYCKPTDSNSLLYYSSCHPRTTRDSLPRSQFNRVSRIVSNPEVRKERLDTVAQKFKLRHYPSRLLDNEKARILAPPSPPPPMYSRERVPFVHTFHPSMPKVYSIIKRHWPLLSRAYPSIDSCKAPTLICTKRTSNIWDKLDSSLAELNQIGSLNFGNFRFLYPILRKYRNSLSEFRNREYRPIPDICSIGMLNTSP
ncbi:unnamed protein product [Ranitomeya imitator]|uniref:ribonuclease H n=1 Tax=Ranitomeya imitator TaxID=111125 RepID=A0ABN9L5S0_9NEOB|nr:unnamed protein product [Ranitomeya imitator]